MKHILTLSVFLLSHTAILVAQDKPPAVDSTALMDSLMREIDSYLDLMLTSKSFFDANIGIGSGFYNFEGPSSTYTTEKKLLYAPSLSYYHKSGLAISGVAYVINDSSKLNAYQYAITPSYVYTKLRRWSLGVSYTRYFTKDKLSFYTSPLENEVTAYFNYKRWWLQPGIVVNYGWGSKTSFKKRRLAVLSRRLGSDTYILVRNDESIQDLSTLFSVRHDFNFRKLITSRDHIVITPIMLISAGTQNFGFNTSFQSRYAVLNNYSPSNFNITDKRGMDFQSITFVLRLNYTLGKFYLQPQALLDYYLHSADDRFNTGYSLIMGVNF